MALRGAASLIVAVVTMWIITILRRATRIVTVLKERPHVG
jgi:hypothetical protein